MELFQGTAAMLQHLRSLLRRLQSPHQQQQQQPEPLDRAATDQGQGQGSADAAAGKAAPPSLTVQARKKLEELVNVDAHKGRLLVDSGPEVPGDLVAALLPEALSGSLQLQPVVTLKKTPVTGMVVLGAFGSAEGTPLAADEAPVGALSVEVVLAMRPGQGEGEERQWGAGAASGQGGGSGSAADQAQSQEGEEEVAGVRALLLSPVPWAPRPLQQFTPAAVGSGAEAQAQAEAAMKDSLFSAAVAGDRSGAGEAMDTDEDAGGVRPDPGVGDEGPSVSGRDVAAEATEGAAWCLQQVRAAGQEGLPLHQLDQQWRQRPGHVGRLSPGSSGRAATRTRAALATAVSGGSVSAGLQATLCALLRHGLVRLLPGYTAPYVVASEHSQMLVHRFPAPPPSHRPSGSDEAGPAGDGGVVEVPLWPWLDHQGRVNRLMLGSLVRRILALVERQPGVPEVLLLGDMDSACPGAVRALLAALVLQGRVRVATRRQEQDTQQQLLVAGTGHQPQVIGMSSTGSGRGKPSFLKRSVGGAAPVAAAAPAPAATGASGASAVTCMLDALGDSTLRYYFPVLGSSCKPLELEVAAAALPTAPVVAAGVGTLEAAPQAPAGVTA